MSTPTPRKRTRSIDDGWLHHMMRVQEKDPTAPATPRKIGPVEDLGDGALSSGMTTDDCLALDLPKAVKEEVHRLRVRDEARAVFNAQSRVPIPKPYTFADYLSRPRPSEPYRIDKLLRTGARSILSAPAKAGKSTVRDHLVHCVVEGEPLFGQFETTRPSGNVVVLDFEMPQIETQDRFEKMGADYDRAVFWELVGKAAAFNILDKACRQEWAAALVEQQTSVLIVDTLGTLLAALGLDEKAETRKLLIPLDELIQEAGISEVVILHHFGHVAERSRGDSFLRGWPDHEWLIKWDGQAASPRYFSTGLMRNGYVLPDQEMVLDQSTRQLTLGGSRPGRASTSSNSRVWEAIRELLSDYPGLNGSEVKTALKDKGRGFGKGPVDAELRAAVSRGDLFTKAGDNNAFRYSLDEWEDD